MRAQSAALFGLAAALAGCASGARPIKQLETFDVMVGGSLNAPGVEFDPEFTGFVRFAPYKYFDLTIGGQATLPLFNAIMYGALAEARIHIPAGDFLRIVLDGTVEFLNYKIDERRRIGVERLTFTPLFVYEQAEITPYFGPKLMYLSNLDLDGGPELRLRGSGVYMLGLIIGIEDEVAGLTIGGTVDFGVLMNGRNVNDIESVATTGAFYVAY